MKPTLIFETTQSTPKAELLHFEAELAEEENWNVIQQGLEARLVEHPDGKAGACAAWECPSLGTPTNGGKTRGRCRGSAGALGTPSAKPFENGAKCSGEKRLTKYRKSFEIKQTTF